MLTISKESDVSTLHWETLDTLDTLDTLLVASIIPKPLSAKGTALLVLIWRSEPRNINAADWQDARSHVRIG